MKNTKIEVECNEFESQSYLRDRCKKCFQLKSKHLLEKKQPDNYCKKESKTTCNIPVNSKLLHSTLTPLTSISIISPSIIKTKVEENDTLLKSTSNIKLKKLHEFLPKNCAENASLSSKIQINRPKSLTGFFYDNVNSNNYVATVKTSSSFNKKERRKSYKDQTINNDEGADCEDTTDSISLSSYKTANSKEILSTKSVESVNSVTDSKSMITAMSEESINIINENDEDRATTPTEVNGGEITLKKENLRLRHQVQKLKAERRRWIYIKKNNDISISNNNLVELLEERLVEAENLLQDYRDENSMLKSELHELQENSATNVKIKVLEKKCEELTLNNRELEKNNKELHEELEEMQDQYREEEINEFRELQRELEQNSKNCRILQFKLRKSERQIEQLQTEKKYLSIKLCEFQQNSAQNLSNIKLSQKDDDNLSKIVLIKDIRIKEVESELRIAKEVSVRLYNELESAEDKKYKLEDEIFYYKEKIRELQTQNKWRETRNKVDKINKFQNQEFPNKILTYNENAKELQDVLERETDLRDQLKFAEENLQRTQKRLKEAENENEDLMRKLVNLTEVNSIRAQINAITLNKKRAPMIRSFSEGKYETLDIVKFNLKTPILEGITNNEPLSKKDFSEIDQNSSLLTKKQHAELLKKIEFDSSIENNIYQLLSTIQELKKKNKDLEIQLQKNESKNAKLQMNSVNAEKRDLFIELQKEKNEKKQLLKELLEYKQLISKSDNYKLISLATKLEFITNKYNLLNERFFAIHKKFDKELGNNTKYADELKHQCDLLETEISKLKTKEIFTNELKLQNHATKPISSDTIEQYCILLTSIDTQTNRISKQIEKIELAQKEERRRSLNKDSYAIVVADLANVMAELKNLQKVLNTNETFNLTVLNSKDFDTNKKKIVEDLNKTLEQKNCGNCIEKNKQIDSQKQEISFLKKKTKELTNQIISTEDRWTAEIEKQNKENQEQIKKLKTELSKLNCQYQEQIDLTKAQTNLINEKDKIIDELKIKIESLTIKVENKKKIICDLEIEQKQLKEWEIKYKKLENLYEKEKEKFSNEKLKIKNEANTLKKKTDEALLELAKLRDGHQRREILWNEERKKLEKEIFDIKNKFFDNNSENIEKSVSAINNSVPICVVNYRTAAVAATVANTKAEVKTGDQLEEFRQKMLLLEKNNEELKNNLKTTKLLKEELELELNKNKQIWKREKDTITHKKRQEDKVKQVEIETLQQKFASRMNIMETSNKLLHSQLVQARRERDNFCNAITNFENKLKNEQENTENEKNKYQLLINKFTDTEKKLSESLNIIEHLTNELNLSKEAHKADRNLWLVEKAQWSVLNKNNENVDFELHDRRIAEDALNAAEKVQKQYSEYQKFYTKEVTCLKTKIRELNKELLTKENDFQKKTKELSEQIRILEIDQKNLAQIKKMQSNAFETIQIDNERLVQILQQTEVQNITRRFKLSSIIEQLNSYVEKNVNTKREQIKQDSNNLLLSNIINQLSLIKQDITTVQCPTAASETFSEADTTAPSDTLSQSSISSQITPQINLNKNKLFSRQNISTIASNNRSCSIESNTTWDSRLLDFTTRSVSPTKKLLNIDCITNKNVEIEGLKHNKINLKSMTRSMSYDKDDENNLLNKLNNRNLINNQLYFKPTQMQSMNALITVDTDLGSKSENKSYARSRMNSTGTNILYKIQRDELSKGTTSSILSMTKAYESITTPTNKQKFNKIGSVGHFFNIRKSRSVDNEAKKQNENNTQTLTSNLTRQPVHLSISQIEYNNEVYDNSVRSGRNSFKNLKSKIVERVRRSLSRSKKRTASPEKLLKERTTQIDINNKVN